LLVQGKHHHHEQQVSAAGVTMLSMAECDELLSRYAPRSVDRQTLPPLPVKLAF